MLLKANRETKS